MTDAATINEIDADYIIRRLEEAGATLLALPGGEWSTRMRSASIDTVRTAIESYGWTTPTIRPPAPSGDKITRMDEAMAWLALIPREKYVLRRVVGARSLVHPITDQHLFPWRRLGAALGADHKAIQRWHAQGTNIIVKALRHAPDCTLAPGLLPPDDQDICGLCGEPGADKVPHPVRWPGERAPDTEFVHAACEHAECTRAHGELSDRDRDAFLRTL